jgi:predicted N-acetyltransferase YhbS
MPLTLRRAKPDDAPILGRICYDAFRAISSAHNFPPDFPSVQAATELVQWVISRGDDGVFSVVAELDGRVVGSNFLWENGLIAGVGPITVDPSVQNAAIGRRMMERVIERAREKKLAGVRLVQAAFHSRSMSLYAKLGFDVKEPLVAMQGKPPGVKFAGRNVRPAAMSDLDACNALCWRVHGHNRSGEAGGAIAQKTAMVVEHDGRITGYATAIGFFAHAVGETNEDIQALISSAKEIAGPGLLLPTRNTELFRWCLSHGLRVTQPMTLMALGLYSEPRGPFLPSILY